MDVCIEPEDASRDVPRGKLIFLSLYTKSKLVFISFDLRGQKKMCKYRQN